MSCWCHWGRLLGLPGLGQLVESYGTNFDTPVDKVAGFRIEAGGHANGVYSVVQGVKWKPFRSIQVC